MSWALRLLWLLRGKRLVRIHLKDDYPTVEGLLAGRWGGHYVLLKPSICETPERTVATLGHLEVPTENVVFVQVLAP